MEKQKHWDTGTRRLPGPAGCRLGEGALPPEAHYELFRDWQRTQTQSSVMALGEPETANGCPVLHRMRGPSAVRHSCATLNPDQSNARSRERAQRPYVFFLTLTYMEVGVPSL